MNSFISFLQSILRGMQPWIVVTPWEQALRIRLGKRVGHLLPGIHLRIPGVDRFYVQSVRRRIVSTGRQTIDSGGKPITLTATLTYSIDDLLRLYMTLHDAQGTIVNATRSALATSMTKLGVFTPQDVLERASKALGDCGITVHEVSITELVAVKTIRLIGDYGCTDSGSHLDTTSQHFSTQNGPVTP